MKRRVYLETSVISYLVGWLNQRSILVAHNQEFTREWWSGRRHEYELFSSAVAIHEARRGEGHLANERLGFLAETTLLDITDAARVEETVRSLRPEVILNCRSGRQKHDVRRGPAVPVGGRDREHVFADVHCHDDGIREIMNRHNAPPEGACQEEPGAVTPRSSKESDGSLLAPPEVSCEGLRPISDVQKHVRDPRRGAFHGPDQAGQSVEVPSATGARSRIERGRFAMARYIGIYR